MFKNIKTENNFNHAYFFTRFKVKIKKLSDLISQSV